MFSYLFFVFLYRRATKDNRPDRDKSGGVASHHLPDSPVQSRPQRMRSQDAQDGAQAGTRGIPVNAGVYILPKSLKTSPPPFENLPLSQVRKN